jgi:hypothetical protein
MPVTHIFLQRLVGKILEIVVEIVIAHKMGLTKNASSLKRFFFENYFCYAFTNEGFHIFTA